MEHGQRRRASDIREISVSSNMLNSLKWLKFVFKEPQFKSQESKGAWIRAERVKPRPLVSHLTTLMITTGSTGSVALAWEIFHRTDGLSFPSVVHYCEL